MKQTHTDFGTALAVFLARHKLHQKDLAEVLGFSRGFVNMVFKGIKPPSTKFYQAIIAYAKSHGYDTEELELGYRNTVLSRRFPGISSVKLEYISEVLDPSVTTEDIIYVRPLLHKRGE